MSQKILKFIVILLAILILFCFIALIYGLYIKSAKKQTNLETNNINYSLNLEEGDEITDIDIIDNNIRVYERCILLFVTDSVLSDGIYHE